MSVRVIRTQFDPRRLGSLIVWLDAGDTATLFDATTGGSLPADGAPAGRWADKSGFGNDATQTTANNRPLRRAGAANSRDALEFDGVNDWMEFPATAFTGASAASILVVSDKLSSGQNGAIFHITNTIEVSTHHPWTDGNIYEGFCRNGRNSYAMTERTDRYVYCVTAGSAYRAYVDGVRIYNNTSNTFVSPTVARIGSGFGSVQHPIYAQILEVLIYKQELTADQVTVAYRYLREKWGAA